MSKELQPFCMKSALHAWFHADSDILTEEDMPIKKGLFKPWGVDEAPKYLVGIQEEEDGYITRQVIDWSDATEYEPFQTASECGTYFVKESDLLNCPIKWFLPLGVHDFLDVAEIARLDGLGVERYSLKKAGE